MRWARAVKKMPLGASTFKLACNWRVWVSYTCTWWLSRQLIHTDSPRGVNYMCSTALPGSRVSMMVWLGVSMTCTRW